MARIRVWQTVEIDGKQYTCIPQAVHPDIAAIGINWTVILARRDGTGTIVIHGLQNGVACSCGRGVRDQWCDHVRALQQVGVVSKPAAPPPSKIGVWDALGAMFGVSQLTSGPRQHFLPPPDRRAQIQGTPPRAIRAGENSGPIELAQLPDRFDGS